MSNRDATNESQEALISTESSVVRFARIRAKSTRSDSTESLRRVALERFPSGPNSHAASVTVFAVKCRTGSPPSRYRTVFNDRFRHELQASGARNGMPPGGTFASG